MPELVGSGLKTKLVIALVVQALALLLLVFMMNTHGLVRILATLLLFLLPMLDFLILFQKTRNGKTGEVMFLLLSLVYMVFVSNSIVFLSNQWSGGNILALVSSILFLVMFIWFFLHRNRFSQSENGPLFLLLTKCNVGIHILVSMYHTWVLM